MSISGATLLIHYLLARTYSNSFGRSIRAGLLVDVLSTLAHIHACDFHHDGSLLTDFDPDEPQEKFIQSVAQAEEKCQQHIEEEREQTCDRSADSSDSTAQLSAQGHHLHNSTSVKCSSKTSDPNFQNPNATHSQMAWARYGFRGGKMPPPFESSAKIRGATGAFVSQEQGEGAGARVRRSIGRPELKNLDPFLMLDEFKVGLPAGFPDHPHRGMETVTYMFPDSPGNFTHEDSKGNAGILGPSDLQWMTAARGIMHSEVPETRNEAHGLQMWINLSKKDKMSPPEYQEIPAKDLARAEATDENGKLVQVQIAAGTSLGETSQVRTRTPCYLIHVKMLEKDAVFRQMIPGDFTAFLYTLEGAEIIVKGDGSSKIGDKVVQGHTTVTLQSNPGAGGSASGGGNLKAAKNLMTQASNKNADAGATGSSGEEKVGIEIRAIRPESQFVVVAARPIGEPIVQYGPFVMTSQAEIQQAFRDYQMGTHGFEGAQQWSSKNKQRMGRGGF
ncbi:unnamed protein product [Amoebophrya sp. A120]|nr:unnamed protein product [Amoebophrya sp. A120]|eukprot:GSA120T00003960001.1